MKILNISSYFEDSKLSSMNTNTDLSIFLFSKNVAKLRDNQRENYISFFEITKSLGRNSDAKHTFIDSNLVAWANSPIKKCFFL